MTTSRRTSTHIGVLGASIIAALVAAGCTHSSSQADDTTDGTATTSTAPLELDDLDGLDGLADKSATTTTAAPAPSPAPSPDQSPTPTLADPPATTTTSPLINLIPPGGLVIKPAVTSIHGRKSFTCAEATGDDYWTPVSWTTVFATKVTLTVHGWGDQTFTDLPPNDSHPVSIPCGTTVTAKVTAVGSNGVTGGSMTLVIIIGAP